MIQQPANWNQVQEFSERKKLPLDAYVCKIKQVQIKSTDCGESLCLLFDISEGEYYNFFGEDFKNNTAENKKWKGVYRQFLPKDDGSENDETAKSRLKGLITSVEKSNPGYVWNWNEKSLEGKTLGIIFRNEEYEFKNDKGKTISGWAVRPFCGCSADTVRTGEYTLPKDKPLAKKSTATPGSFSFGSNADFTDVKDEDLPF